ncbi:MAG: glycosyltransferase family 4 protein [Cyclobacteriaceae bacterium]
MLIAIVINTSWNIYNFRRGLIEGLKSDGHELLLIAPIDDYSDEIGKWSEYIPVKMDNTGSNPFKDIKLMFQLRKIYARRKPNVILHYTIKPNIYGTLAARSLRIPCINNISGLGTIFMNENLTAKIGRWLYRIALSKGCYVLFQNQDDKRDFTSKVKLGVPYSLVPGSGIDTSHFEYNEPPHNEIPRFLLVARLLLDKGILEYLKSARQLKAKGYKAEFALAGEVDESHVRGVPQSEIDEYHSTGDINYLGPVNPIEDEMVRSDWILLPSYREGTPRTLLEGAALGRPLIATDVPGCREVVQHEINGLLCSAKSVDDLTRTIEIALGKTKSQTIAMGRKSRQLAEKKFDEKIVINTYRKLIDELVALI